MIPALHEVVGLSPATSAAEIAHAADRRSKSLLSRASCGDSEAQRALVELRYAYLVWAYAGMQIRSTVNCGPISRTHDDEIRQW